MGQYIYIHNGIRVLISSASYWNYDGEARFSKFCEYWVELCLACHSWHRFKLYMLKYNVVIHGRGLAGLKTCVLLCVLEDKVHEASGRAVEK
jgi:hypothetical protein